MESVNWLTLPVVADHWFWLSPILGLPRWLKMVKNPPAMQETWIWSLGGEEPLEEGMATHSNILAWEIPWTEEPVGLQSMGLQRIRHDRATNTCTFSPILSLTKERRALLKVNLQKPFESSVTIILYPILGKIVKSYNLTVTLEWRSFDSIFIIPATESYDAINTGAKISQPFNYLIKQNALSDPRDR